MRTDCALLNRTRLHFCFLVCKETFWTFATKLTTNFVTPWYQYQTNTLFRKKLVILNICAFYWSKCQWVWVPKSNDWVLLLIFNRLQTVLKEVFFFFFFSVTCLNMDLLNILFNCSFAWTFWTLCSVVHLHRIFEHFVQKLG